MRIKTTTTGLLRVGLGLLGFLLLSVTLGCNHDRYGGQPDLSRRILPPPNVNPDAEPSSAKEPPRAGEGNQARKDQAQPPDKDNSEQARSPTGAPETDPGGQPGQPLDLLNAIALAFRLQPQLRAALEKIQQAQGREDIVFSTFLPLLTSGYLAGGYHIQAGGDGFPISADPNSPKFTILPLLGSIPVGLQGQTGFEVAELKLQWLVCDFGRRLGLYRQADIAVDIAQLQTQRAYQTVANEVAVAYYHLLRTRSLHRIATESVRRGEDDLDVARKLKKEGVIEKEKVLRAEVALSQAQQSLDKAEEAEAVAIAALNLAIGLNVSEATRVVDTTDVPPFPAGLVDCLRIAVDNRREFQVVRRAVQAAQEGSHVARADFAPRIVAEGASWTTSKPTRAATSISPLLSSGWSGVCSRAADELQRSMWLTRGSVKPWPRPNRLRIPSLSRSTKPSARWWPPVKELIALARPWTRPGRPTGWWWSDPGKATQLPRS